MTPGPRLPARGGDHDRTVGHAAPNVGGETDAAQAGIGKDLRLRARSLNSPLDGQLILRYDNGRFFAVGLGTWIESDSSKAQQEFSYGAQAGFNLPLGEHTNLLLGAGYYNFDTAGKGSFFGDGDFFGNSFNPITQTYQYDYREIEGFAELGFELFDRPILLFADYVQNLEVDDNDIGYALGANYGEAKRKGSWEMNYAYKRLEADAVLGLLTDSDFGQGGTDAKGSVISGAYAVHDNWNFRMTYILSETNLASDDPTDLRRLQLDLQFKYK